MQCVILAAGRGVRMGRFTDTCPKPMLPINGKPKLVYSIEHLPREIDEVILIIGYLGEKIRKYFGDTFDNRRIRYVEQKELAGTGGAIHLVKDIVDDRFLVTMGDDLYLKSDLEKLMCYDLAILAKEVEDSSLFGVLESDDHGKLVAIHERPHNPEFHLVNTGAYMLSTIFFDYPLVAISEKEFGLPQTLVEMKDKQNIHVQKAQDWFPIGDPEALQKAQDEIKKFL